MASIDAVRLLARRERRLRRSSLVTIALLVAVVVGVVLATAAGARRTGSVLDRFQEATNAPTGMVGVAWPPLGSDRAAVADLRERLSAADGVGEVTVSHFVLGDAGTKYDFGILTGPDAGYMEVGAPLVQTGRMPALDAPDEVAIPERLATELRIGVGEPLVVPTMSQPTADALFAGSGPFALDGPELTLDVVGVFRDIDDLRPDSGTAAPVAYASPAFFAAHDSARTGAFFQVVGDPGRIDSAALIRTVVEAVPPGAEVFGGVGNDDDPLGVGYRTLALGLVVFSVVAAATGLLAIWLAVGRHVQQAQAEARVMSALGMSRTEVAGGWGAPLALAAAAGAVLGAAGAVAASPLFPISLARRAEPDPGVSLDAGAIVLGTSVSLAVILGVAGVACWRRAASVVRAEPARRLRPPLGASLRGHLGLGGSIGTSLVVEPRHPRTAASPAAALAAAALAVAGVIAVGTFAASQRTAADQPDRYGFAWSAQPDLEPSRLEEPLERFVARLATDDRLVAVGGLFCSLAGHLGDDSAVCALRVAGGAMAPVTTVGRPPGAPGEIALGSLSADRLGVGIGDEVALGDGVSFTVVGEVVLPTIDTDRPGLGAYVTEGGLARLTGSANLTELYEATVQRLLLRFTPGLPTEGIEAALVADYPALSFSAYSTPEPPELVLQLGRLRGLLVVLAGFLGLIAAVGTLHYLALSVRRTRVPTAVLQALGFVRGQVRSVVSWQAATVAAIGVIVGTPLGLIVGRWVWRALVDDLGMIDDPVTPWLLVATVPFVFVGGALVLAAVPARRAARVRPAIALRGE